MTKTLQDILDCEKPEVVQKAKDIAAEMLLSIHLAELREKAALTQQEVASAMGIKQPAVAGMENLGHDISISTLNKYVEASGGKLRIEVEMRDGSHYGFTV